VSDAAAIAALPARVAAAGLPPSDCVISNAGIARGPVARVMSVNFSAALYLFDTFVRRGGARSIVLVASLMATLGAAGLAPYCASKWALLGAAESLRLELQRDGRAGEAAVITLLPSYAAGDGGMFRGVFSPASGGSSASARAAGCLRAAFSPPVSPAALAEAAAAAVLAGGSATLSLPAHALCAARALRCCLPMRAHDALVGWLGGWHGSDGLLAQEAAAPPAAEEAAAAPPAARRRRREQSPAPSRRAKR
jgi:NAD(P)-dependent dehydrogenase (short-subunit alcohol dehydrogenase family)